MTAATTNGTPTPTAETPEPSRAMTVADPRSSVLAFEPGTIEEGLKLCERLVRSGLLPRTIQTPEQAFIVMVAGREMGLRFMQSFRLIHVFDGKTITSAQLIIGKCKERTTICKYFTLVCGSAPCKCKFARPNEPHATYETLRAGNPKPTSITFSLADAKEAKLTGKDNWQKYPWQMCQNRAGAVLARAEYPDVVGGLYDEDEVPLPHVTVTATPIVGAGGNGAPIDAHFTSGTAFDELLEQLARATTDEECIAVGVLMVSKRTEITAADEQTLRAKINDRRREPAIAATAFQKQKDAPKPEASPATTPEAPKSEPKARASEPEPEPKEKPQKRTSELCGASNDGCTCTRPKGHPISADEHHYDEKTQAEWGGA